mgnify:CR=1 FL=1
MATCIIVALIAYLIGSINFSIIISKNQYIYASFCQKKKSKKMAGFDIREKGSGNAGTTNMLRAVGKKAAVITLICDILKGVVSILIAVLAGKIVKNLDNALLVQLAGIFVIIGHTFPVFFKFKGGKGIATALGVLLMINWQIGLICLIFALVLMALTKMVSVGSIAAAILFPILVAFIDQNYIVQTSNSNWSYLVFSIIVALLVIFNHRANVQRILNGTENRLSFKK